MYSIDSTLEYNRYSIKEFVPILYVYIEDNDEIIDEHFLELPHLYSTINLESETSVFSFCDFKISGNTYDYFCRLVSTKYNRKGCNRNINLKIVYYIEFDYVDINVNEKVIILLFPDIAILSIHLKKQNCISMMFCLKVFRKRNILIV